MRSRVGGSLYSHQRHTIARCAYSASKTRDYDFNPISGFFARPNLCAMSLFDSMRKLGNSRFRNQTRSNNLLADVSANQISGEWDGFRQTEPQSHSKKRFWHFRPSSLNLVQVQMSTTIAVYPVPQAFTWTCIGPVIQLSVGDSWRQNWVSLIQFVNRDVCCCVYDNCGYEIVARLLSWCIRQRSIWDAAQSTGESG